MSKLVSERSYRHIDTITGLFVAVLLIANIISSKIIHIGIFPFTGGIVIFPLSYIFGDILTEVYGYKRSRKVIWLGFACNILMAIVLIIVGVLPSAPQWHDQTSYERILGQTPRIVLASLLGYFAGEFSNSFVLAKMKIMTNGKWLWSRTIGSTIIGELLDTIIFICVAFWGILPLSLLVMVIVSNYIVKTLIEVILTPITYAIVYWLKKIEQEDYFDTNTDFNPFLLK